MKFSDKYQEIMNESNDNIKSLSQYPKHLEVERFLNVRKHVLRQGNIEKQEKWATLDLSKMHKVSIEQAERWLADWRKTDHENLKKEREYTAKMKAEEPEKHKDTDFTQDIVNMGMMSVMSNF